VLVRPIFIFFLRKRKEPTMPRKNKTSKKTTTEKKYTTVPPVAKTAAKPVVVAIPAKTETPAVAPVVVAVAPKVLKELSSDSATQRADAATAIGKSNDVSAVKPLLAALHDLDADVAREAATALGLLGDASAVEPLIEIITNANGYFHSVVRSAAAASLALLKDQRAVDSLLNAVYDPIADSSSEAIRALANLGDRRAVSALIEVVRNRSGFFVNSVRRAAVLGLIKLGGEEAQSELRWVSGDGFEDSVIREEATAAIIGH
jgi:HEAT repeat protein